MKKETKVVRTSRLRIILQLLAYASTGRCYTVTFTKRTTGEIRTLTGRNGVKSHRKGGKLSYNPAKNALLPTFEMNTQQYRSINLEGLLLATFNGVTYVADEYWWYKR